MNCPICKNVELKMADRQGIEIDYCPQCRGIWLDRGELDKIIERSNELVPEVASRPSQHDPRHHDVHHDSHGPYRQGGYHQKKSWLSELFD